MSSNEILPNGLRTDGLPDIEWCTEIPQGEYEIGLNEETPPFGLVKQPFTVHHPFKLAKYPITQAQFRAFMQDSSFPKETPDHIVPYTNPPCPRGGVWWSDSFAFGRWLTQKYHMAGLLADDWVIDVPNEAEWELTARYPDGKQWRLNRDLLANKTPDDVYKVNSETGMHISVKGFREWCVRLERYNDTNLPTAVDTILANHDSWTSMMKFIILRGMSATFRFDIAPTWNDDIGFRVVCRQK